MFKIIKDYWVLILLAMGFALIFPVQFWSIGALRRSKDSYKEKYEVAISERDYYKRQVEHKSGFDFEALLTDGMSMSIRVNYQDDYPMSVEQRHRMTIAMRDALSSQRVMPTTQNKMEKELNYQKMLTERNELFKKMLNDK